MRITGTVLDVEAYAGTFKGDDGVERPYAGKRLHVLDGREVVKVKVGKDQLNSISYGIGEQVDLRVQVSANAGARGAYLTVGLLGDYPPA